MAESQLQRVGLSIKEGVAGLAMANDPPSWSRRAPRAGSHEGRSMSGQGRNGRRSLGEEVRQQATGEKGGFYFWGEA